MFDQSSGHGQMRQDALNTNSISVRWSGKQDKIRTIVIKELGPFNSKLDVGKEQKMIFTGVNDGPFYLSDNHCLSQKYGTETGRQFFGPRQRRKLEEN